MTTWYHGTRRAFAPGGLLLPRAEHGGPGTLSPLNPGRTSPAGAESWCYVTRDPEVAEAYAQHAPGRGRPKVLTVQPHGDLHRDPEHGPATDAWRCEWATVLAVQTLHTTERTAR